MTLYYILYKVSHHSIKQNTFDSNLSNRYTSVCSNELSVIDTIAPKFNIILF